MKLENSILQADKVIEDFCKNISTLEIKGSKTDFKGILSSESNNIKYLVDVYEVSTPYMSLPYGLQSKTFIATTDNATLFSYGSGSISEELWDGSISVKARVTIYFKKINVSEGVDKVQLQRAVFSNYVSDKTVKIIGQTLFAAQNGPSVPNGYPKYVHETTGNISLTNQTYYSLITGFKDYPMLQSSMTSLRAKNTLHLKRGSKPGWTLSVTAQFGALIQ